MNQESLLRITEGFHRTSTIANLEDRSVTFAKDQEWFDKLLKTDKHVCTIIKSTFEVRKSLNTEEFSAKIIDINSKYCNRFGTASSEGKFSMLLTGVSIKPGQTREEQSGPILSLTPHSTLTTGDLTCVQLTLTIFIQ